MTTITIERKLLEQALDALDNSVDVVFEEYTDAVQRYANIPSRKAKLDGLAAMAKAHLDTYEAIRTALAAPATAPAPTQLRQGECWPENTMAQWDYYRKLIAEGDTSSAPRDWFESLAEMRLIAAPATAPEQCWCDEQNIGEPGVSCGDCPTRDYKYPATAPAWHDAPTCAGLWLNNFNFTAKRFDYWHFQSGGHWGTGVKWYGPIPEDKL